MVVKVLGKLSVVRIRKHGVAHLLINQNEKLVNGNVLESDN